MNDLSKEINELLLENETIKEYLTLKKIIKNDKVLQQLLFELDNMRKHLCKNKDSDSRAYYKLLDCYNNDIRVKRFKMLEKEIYEYFSQISDILSLK